MVCCPITSKVKGHPFEVLVEFDGVRSANPVRPGEVARMEGAQGQETGDGTRASPSRRAREDQGVARDSLIACGSRSLKSQVTLRLVRIDGKAFENPIDSPAERRRSRATQWVAVSALHFYEAKGLIKSHRTNGNQRRYPRDVLRRVAVIKVAQRTGVPLQTIRTSAARVAERQTADGRRLEQTLGALEGRARRSDQTSDRTAGSARWLHRLRLHVVEGLSAAESVGRARTRRRWPAAARSIRFEMTLDLDLT